MDANIVDLRYKMSQVIAAIKRNEKVDIFYHGKKTAIMIPAGKDHSSQHVVDHPLFGMHAKEKRSVKEEMEILRGGRYRDL